MHFQKSIYLGLGGVLVALFTLCGPVNACVNCMLDGSLWSCLSDPGAGYDTCTITGGGSSCGASGSCTSGCLLPGSMVSTPNGPVPIEQLNVGDLVLTRGFGGKIGTAKVDRVYKTTSAGYLVINGSIRVTTPHPFKSGGKWLTAGQLQVGNVIDGEFGSVVVKSVDFVNKGVRVFNLEVADTHTFFVDGALVHNKPENVIQGP